MNLPNLKSGFLKPKQDTKASIGIDWGFSSLKVVVLERREDISLLKDARIVELPSKNPDLSSVFKDLDITSGINLGICGPNVVVRYLPMAKMKEEEFRSALSYEAASHLPFPIEQLIVDGVILKDLPDNKMLVMLAAAKKVFVNERLKLFQEKGIKVKVLDIDSLALMNAFNYTHPIGSHVAAGEEQGKPAVETHKGKDLSSGAVVLLNIGASVANMNVLESGIPHFSRDIDVAVRHLAKVDSDDTGVANFVFEIRKSLDYYEAGSVAAIHKIFLSGGGSLVPDLIHKLENFLDISVERWDPFSNFQFAPGLDEASIRANSAQFAVAVGLVLR